MSDIGAQPYSMLSGSDNNGDLIYNNRPAGVGRNTLTNHANYTGYVGALTSPFFGRPTTVNNMRKIEFLVNFQF